MNETSIITNIKELIGIQTLQPNFNVELQQNLNCIKKAYLIVENGLIKDFGEMSSLKLESQNYDHLINLENKKSILPVWNDSHTHIVFAGTRETEFVDRINGLSYEDIAKRGGGILNSANKLEKTPFNDLLESSSRRLEKVMQMGTGAIEIKSGYGLTLESELKMLRVIASLKEKYNIPIKSTFLGAHAFPAKYKQQKSQYIDLIINEMLPAIATENLADYIDVFCEKNYFSVAEMEKILQAGNKYNLKPKVHVNQFNSIGAIQKAIEMGAVSVDHLEVLNDKDIDALKNSSTIATLLPSCSLFINIPYAKGKTLIENKVPFALASDYNPGSTPCGNMNLVVSLACINMKITPEVAINAGTIMGAKAMEIENESGSITKGKLASLIVTEDISSYNFIPYSFGENNIERVMIKGKWI